MNRPLTWLLALTVAALTLTWVSAESTLLEGARDEPIVWPHTRLVVGDDTIDVEVANRPAQRRRGLMGRTRLPADHGMLFVYEEPDTLSFWMKDTELPLAIAFVGSDGRVLDIRHMAPNTRTRHTSPAPARYAIEMGDGWFRRHGVRRGTTVRTLDGAPLAGLYELRP